MKVSAAEVIRDPKVHEDAVRSLVAGEEVHISSSTDEIHATTQAYHSPEVAHQIQAGRAQKDLQILVISAGGGTILGTTIGVLFTQYTSPASRVAVDAACAVLGGIITTALVEGIRSGHVKGVSITPAFETPGGNKFSLKMAATF
jgi:hypothetical protein